MDLIEQCYKYDIQNKIIRIIIFFSLIGNELSNGSYVSKDYYDEKSNLYLGKIIITYDDFITQYGLKSDKPGIIFLNQNTFKLFKLVELYFDELEVDKSIFSNNKIKGLHPNFSDFIINNFTLNNKEISKFIRDKKMEMILRNLDD